MKLQARSIGLKNMLGRRTDNSAAEGNISDSGMAELPRSNMQSLAAELQQSALQGEFQYPANWSLVARTFAVLLVMLSVAHAALVLMAEIRTLGGGVQSILTWSTLGCVLGIGGASLVAAFLTNIFPVVKVTPEGLGVSEVTGWRTIPWKQITVLRVMELRNHSRYVVLIPFNGKTKPATPAPMMSIFPALMGAMGWGGKGLLLTSDIKNFDKLLQLVVSYMVQSSGQNPNAVPLEAYVDEDALMPIAQLFLDYETEIVRIATSPNSNTELYGVSNDSADPPVPWAPVLKQQLLIALVPALVLMVDVLLFRGERSFVWQHAAWALFLVVLGMSELPFVGMLVRAVGELMVGSGQFNRTVKAYLELQVPRTVLVAVGGALLGIALPAIFAQVLWLAGILVTTFLTVRFVQRLYYVPFTHTLLAALGTFIFQFSVLALYFGVR
jgi:hypothetical protein